MAAIWVLQGGRRPDVSDLKRVISFLVQSAVVGLAAAFVVVYLFPEVLPHREAPSTEPGSYADAVAAASPAVVNIVSAADPDAVLPARCEGVRAGIAPGESLGSGVVVRSDGLVVTNHHVIDCVAAIDVILIDGRSGRAQVEGTDPDTDIALLSIPLTELPAVRLGRSDTLRVGDVVLAIGNPFSIGQTVTQGIVSGTRRGQLGLSPFESFIQTDAAINVGNSGGALVNAGGDLVGINTAFFSRRLDSEGIGFAIPINLVRGVMVDLLQHGRVIRGWLGVGTSTLTPEQADSLGLSEDFGIILTRVVPGSPAHRAGLQVSDVITHVNDKPVVVWQDALKHIAGLEPGTQVELTGNRLGQPFRVVTEVAERPPQT